MSACLPSLPERARTPHSAALWPLTLFLLLAGALWGCGTPGPASPDGGETNADAGSNHGAPGTDGGLLAARPYQLKVPVGHDGKSSLPLVVLLHGYGSSSSVLDAALGLSTLADQRGFLVAKPEGTLEPISNRRFWNATDACCNYAGRPVDDVAYLTALVEDVRQRQPVDAKRIFFVGHSNGGFMSHRMACDRPDWVAGIVSFAGATWKDATQCAGTAGSPAILQVHGTSDGTIQYGGGTLIGAEYPGAVETVTQWATRYACAPGLASAGTNADFIDSLPGAETKRDRFNGCARGAVELWSMEAAPHSPDVNATLAPAIFDFLMSHPKP